MAVQKQPFGTYPITQVISANAQTEIIAALNSFASLLPRTDPNFSGPQPSPDFADIPPHTAEKLRAEIAFLVTNVDAAPTS